MKNLTTIIISVALFLASAAAFYFLDIPQNQQIKDKEKQIAQTNANISSKMQYNELISKQYQALQDASWDSKKASLMVNFDKPLFFVYKIQDFFGTVAKDTGITIEEATYSTPESVKTQPAPAATGEGGAPTTKQPATPSTEESGSTASVKPAYFDQVKGPVMKTTFNLTITGTYNEFRNFLKELEGQTRIITVNSVTLVTETQPGEGQTGTGGVAGGGTTISLPLAPNEVPLKLVVDAYSY